LFIEDHVDTAAATAHLLRGSGYGVTTARNAAEARTLAAQAKFDIALCDVGLPDADGCDLFCELRSEYGMPGIAVTGYIEPEDLERAIRAGFAAHVVKPYDFGKLVQVIECVLAGERPLEAVARSQDWAQDRAQDKAQDRAQRSARSDGHSSR
jgi:CheY-like chemotaxis protein